MPQNYGGGLQPPQPPLLPTPLLNQSISCFVIGVVFLLVASLFLLNLASVVREWVKLSRSVEQRFWGSGYTMKDFRGRNIVNYYREVINTDFI